jgi:Tat protein secretion system quality control protein TatD with DNase activity
VALVCSNSEEADWQKMRKLVAFENKSLRVIPAFGIHPWKAGSKREKDWQSRLRAVWDQIFRSHALDLQKLTRVC